MANQNFNFSARFTSTEKLEQIFISLAPEVFSFFNKDLQQTTMTVYQNESSDFYEDDIRSHCLTNDTISIKISRGNHYCDNSMSSQWMHVIKLWIRCSTNDSLILFLGDAKSIRHYPLEPEGGFATVNLHCYSNFEYQDFIDYYLGHLRAAIDEIKPGGQ